MTTSKLVHVLEFYQTHLATKHGAELVQRNDSASHPDHLFWMCHQCITEFIPDGHIDKAMRWLGFIQGVLFCYQDFTLAELRDHSRSE